jgi:hypothetical protein
MGNEDSEDAQSGSPFVGRVSPLGNKGSLLRRIDDSDRSRLRDVCFHSAVYLRVMLQTRLFEFERNWLSPVMVVWLSSLFCSKITRRFAGISLAVTPDTGVTQ